MTMQRFAHANATSVEEAVQVLNEMTRPLAGGTDLIPMMKEELTAPERLVNIKTLKGLDGIEQQADGWHIGALMKLSELAAHDAIRDDPAFAGLMQAILESASPQLRHMATIGGNLVQRPRCWYFRNNKVPCWRKGGRKCFAYQGLNKYHTIFSKGPCYAVHPSDPAVALLALDASVLLSGPEGRRTLPFGEFYAPPMPDRQWADGYHPATVLAPDELITEIIVPTPAQGMRSAYIKTMERSAWDFALVSVAVNIVVSQDTVEDVRIALGGVATVPYRATEAETALRGMLLTDETVRAAIEATVAGARPLEYNEYKIDLLGGAMRLAFEAVR